MKKKIASMLLLVFILINTNCLSVVQAVENEDKTLKTEHLEQTKQTSEKSPTNIVVTTPTLNTVIEYNVFEIEFAENFTTKTAKEGDEIGFLLNDGLKTIEGTKILPDGSRIIAEVTNITKPKSFNRSGKVTLVFDRVLLPDGRQIPLNAKLYAKKDQLSRGKLNALGKGLGTTLGVGAIGVGAGCGIGVAAGAVVVGGLAIGLPIGIAVGALAGLVTPGLHYKANPGDKLLIQLTDNLEIKN